MKTRLQKIMAQAGIASRRKCEDLIAAGRVKINGVVVTEAGSTADIETDEIQVDDQPIQRQKYIYLLLNKPCGYIVTRQDTHARKTIYDLLPVEFHHLHPVGRLDRDSCGLLLLTNDGTLTHRLLHPRHKVEKAYRVIVDGQVTDAMVQQWRSGVPLNDGMTLPAKVKIIEDKPVVLEFRIKEGRKRQIRRMCRFFRLNVLELYRFQLGNLQLGDLKPGAYRILSDTEKNTLL